MSATAFKCPFPHRRTAPSPPSPAIADVAVGAPPPTPRRYPVVGHLPWVVGQGGVFGALLGARARFPEGLFRLHMPSGRQPTFVLSARIAAEVCDETRFHKGTKGPLELLRDVAGDGLFTASHGEPAWHLAHKMLVPGFTASAMDRYFPQMHEVVSDLIAHWERAADAGRPVDVSDDMTRLTLDTIALCGFDRRFNSFARPALAPFLQALARVLTHTERRVRRPPIMDRILALQTWRYRRDVDTLTRVVDEVIAARKRVPESSWPRDFLSLMISERTDGLAISDENVRHQVITFLIAGHETTSAMLSFTLKLLLDAPAHLSALRQEVDHVVASEARGDASELTLASVVRLKGVRRALSEALRLYPPAMAFQVTPHADTIVDGRWLVRQGEPIVVFLPAVHRDADVWDDPERFDPDRFLPEREALRPANTYKPFGNGKRACIGRQFALVEATLALARVLHAFDLEHDGAPLALRETLTIKPDRLRIIPRRRARVTLR
jgi:cytochrome P450/NADPH-cytochrome P450 reductase